MNVMPSVCDPVHTGRAGSSPILSAYGPHPLPRWLRIPRRVRRGGARPPDAAARHPATPHGAGGQRHGAGVVLGAEAVLQRGGGRARPAGPPRPRDARRARVQRRVLRARWQDRARPGGDRALACRRPRHRRRHRVRSRPSRGRRGRRSLGGQPALARTHLESFLSYYKADDGWSGNARDVLARLR